jgi:crotonobetainyl-CoA:carnitine CoA-transferase CaiB-like acyl-CoA transferase
MLTYLAIWNLNDGFTPRRYPGSAHQTLVPVQTFRTRDGSLTMFCGKEKFWHALCGVLADSQLMQDARFATFESRFKHREETVEILQRHFLNRTTAEWMSLLQGKVPCAPVRSLGEAMSEPGLAESGTILEVEHPKFGRIREVNTPVRFEGQREQHQFAPRLGQDTDFVLRNYLGYSEDKIAELRRAQVV